MKNYLFIFFFQYGYITIVFLHKKMFKKEYKWNKIKTCYKESIKDITKFKQNYLKKLNLLIFVFYFLYCS